MYVSELLAIFTNTTSDHIQVVGWGWWGATKWQKKELSSRAGRYDDNYRLSWYVIMTITINYHCDIITNFSNYIFASL